MSSMFTWTLILVFRGVKHTGLQRNYCRFNSVCLQTSHGIVLVNVDINTYELRITQSPCLLSLYKQFMGANRTVTRIVVFLRSSNFCLSYTRNTLPPQVSARLVQAVRCGSHSIHYIYHTCVAYLDLYILIYVSCNLTDIL